MVYKFFDKKTSGGAVKSKTMSNQQLHKELHKPIIKIFETRKVHLSFINNIWHADLADIELINKFNKGFRFLLFVVDIYSKYAWAVSLKDKTGIPITSAFQKILVECISKPNKVNAANLTIYQ